MIDGAIHLPSYNVLKFHHHEYFHNFHFYKLHDEKVNDECAIVIFSDIT